MKRRILFLLLLLSLAFAGNAAADDATKEKPGYELRQSFQYNFERHYVFTEKTNVVRTNADGTEKKFLREVTYYLTQLCDTINNDRSVVLSVNIDSMEYRFTEDGSVVFYNSVVDKGNSPKLKFTDLSIATALLNRTFQIFLTPYGDFANAGGETIEYWRNYIVTEGKDADTLTKFTWLDALSFNNLQHIADLHKGVLTGTKMKEDSTWSRILHFRSEGANFSAQNSTNKISQITDGKIFIETEFPTASAKTGAARFYGINEISTIKGGQGAGNLALTLSTNGVLSDALLKFSGTLEGEAGKEKFKEKISSESSWKLVSQNPL